MTSGFPTVKNINRWIMAVFIQMNDARRAALASDAAADALRRRRVTSRRRRAQARCGQRYILYSSLGASSGGVGYTFLVRAAPEGAEDALRCMRRALRHKP
jgi:hypothetical protein